MKERKGSIKNTGQRKAVVRKKKGYDHER